MPLPWIAMQHLWQESEWYDLSGDSYLPEIEMIIYGIGDRIDAHMITLMYLSWILLTEYGMGPEYNDIFDIDPEVTTFEESWEAYKLSTGGGV